VQKQQLRVAVARLRKHLRANFHLGEAERASIHSKSSPVQPKVQVKTTTFRSIAL